MNEFDDDDAFEIDLPDDVQAQLTTALQEEFVDDCTANIEKISAKLEDLFQENGEPQAILKEIRGLTHTMKGSSAMFGYPGIGIITHRLENYLSCDAALGRAEIKEVYGFFDQISALLERTTQPQEDELAQIVRALPVRMQADQIVGAQQIVEVLLVMPKNVQRRMIAEEVKSCGFRVTVASSVFQAVEMAALTKPDLILTSAVLDHLDGMQFAHMIRAMKSTKDTPLMLITSFADHEQHGQALPDGAVIVRKGQDFPGDFSDAAIKMGLLGNADAA